MIGLLWFLIIVSQSLIFCHGEEINDWNKLCDEITDQLKEMEASLYKHISYEHSFHSNLYNKLKPLSNVVQELNSVKFDVHRLINNISFTKTMFNDITNKLQTVIQDPPVLSSKSWESNIQMILSSLQNILEKVTKAENFLSILKDYGKLSDAVVDRFQRLRTIQDRVMNDVKRWMSKNIQARIIYNRIKQIFLKSKLENDEGKLNMRKIHENVVKLHNEFERMKNIKIDIEGYLNQQIPIMTGKKSDHNTHSYTNKKVGVEVIAPSFRKTVNKKKDTTATDKKNKSITGGSKILENKHDIHLEEDPNNLGQRIKYDNRNIIGDEQSEKIISEDVLTQGQASDNQKINVKHETGQQTGQLKAIDIQESHVVERNYDDYVIEDVRFRSDTNVIVGSDHSKNVTETDEEDEMSKQEDRIEVEKREKLGRSANSKNYHGTNDDGKHVTEEEPKEITSKKEYGKAMEGKNKSKLVEDGKKKDDQRNFTDKENKMTRNEEDRIEMQKRKNSEYVDTDKDQYGKKGDGKSLTEEEKQEMARKEEDIIEMERRRLGHVKNYKHHYGKKDYGKNLTEKEKQEMARKEEDRIEMERRRKLGHVKNYKGHYGKKDYGTNFTEEQKQESARKEADRLAVERRKSVGRVVNYNDLYGKKNMRNNVTEEEQLEMARKEEDAIEMEIRRKLEHIKKYKRHGNNYQGKHVTEEKQKEIASKEADRIERRTNSEHVEKGNHHEKKNKGGHFTEEEQQEMARKEEDRKEMERRIKLGHVENYKDHHGKKNEVKHMTEEEHKRMTGKEEDIIEVERIMTDHKMKHKYNANVEYDREELERKDQDSKFLEQRTHESDGEKKDEAYKEREDIHEKNKEKAHDHVKEVAKRKEYDRLEVEGKKNDAGVQTIAKLNKVTQ